MVEQLICNQHACRFKSYHQLLELTVCRGTAAYLYHGDCELSALTRGKYRLSTEAHQCRQTERVEGKQELTHCKSKLTTPKGK